MIQERDFNVWFQFFKQQEGSLIQFIRLLKKKDFYFLNHGISLDYDDEKNEYCFPEGFLEKDIIEIIHNENPKNTYFKTRLAIALFFHIDLSNIQEKIGKEQFELVIEKTLIDGEYEQYGIEFSKIIQIVLEKKYISRNSLVDISFFRGVHLGSKYNNKKEEKQLKKIVFFNRCKIYLPFIKLT